ncbi:hypothetical protein [Novosphingobium sp. FKTRR1]|uniref:hypothetical protein n=1 Tax=Novosphingobium sp. FKTRR1 TaxID=2879118 RepID=UPI001CEFD402|nr:hypothetical protein [Novosphingobium sp. FKTRR1]
MLINLIFLLSGGTAGFVLGALARRSPSAAPRQRRILDHDQPAPMRSAYRKIV